MKEDKVHSIEQKAQSTRKEALVSAALDTLVTACETFIQGAGCGVEVDLDYCAALAQIERATQQGKRVLHGVVV
jgi:hypothetical protein